MNPLSLLEVDDQVQPMRVFPEVKNPDLLTEVDQLLRYPRTDATKAAGHQDTQLISPCDLPEVYQCEIADSAARRTC